MIKYETCNKFSDSIQYQFLCILIVVVYRMLIKLAYYMYSLTLFSKIMMYILAFLLFSLPFLVIGVILLQIRRKKVSNFNRLTWPIMTIVFLFLSIYVVQPDYVLATKALSTNFKNRPDDIVLLQNWLMTYDINHIPENGKIRQDDWPEIIRSLSPRIVYVYHEPDVYARLVWGSGVLGSYGIVIGIDVDKIPLDILYVSEYRIAIDEDVFVWCALKRP